jgi:hypothetical protein
MKITRNLLSRKFNKTLFAVIICAGFGNCSTSAVSLPSATQIKVGFIALCSGITAGYAIPLMIEKRLRSVLSGPIYPAANSARDIAKDHHIMLIFIGFSSFFSSSGIVYELLTHLDKQSATIANCDGEVEQKTDAPEHVRD